MFVVVYLFIHMFYTHVNVSIGCYFRVFSYIYIYLLSLPTLLHFSQLYFSTCIFLYFHICIFLYYDILIIVYFHIFIHFRVLGVLYF